MLNLKVHRVHAKVVNVALQKARVLDAQHVLLMTASVQLVVQIIIVIAGNASPVLMVNRHHRAVHLLIRAPLVPLVPNQLGHVQSTLNVSVLLFLFVAKYIEG